MTRHRHVVDAVRASDHSGHQFQASDLAVLAFDQRGLGTSAGEPRSEINVWASAHEYLSATDLITSLPEPDAGRVAVWGR